MKRYLKGGLAILLVAVLAACSKITPTNFEKVDSGMSKSQVEAILGEPTESSGASLLGLSGGNATWRDGKTRISVQYLNGKVVGKSLDSGAGPAGGSN